ncbi:MAG: radical SAM family heme chaperone HemW [Chloroflexi bacterium]|nr:radical SAM family heme chaperone HemW [Chloroflexota bacterium]
MRSPIKSSPSVQKGNPAAPREQEPLALYIHIPFCETKCPYCDFNTYAGIEQLIPTYIDALIQEVGLWSVTLGPVPIGTIFFGGGTPSYVPPEHIGRLLSTVRSAFTLAANAEITLESNPGDVTMERLARWRAAGVNRLSIGVQSLDDELLRLLGRRHTSQDAVDAFGYAQAAGFDDVNLDLMYGLPDQSIDQWRRTLQDTIALGPRHLSLYCLTREEGTPLEAWVRDGSVPTPDPDLAADMYELAEEIAGRSGFEHYEISNWALPGHACRHNLSYWRNQSYLGVGPGAHSYLQGHRFANLSSPREYIKRVSLRAAGASTPKDFPSALRDGPVDMMERVDARLEMGETMMLGLRLADGVTGDGFNARFGQTLMDVFGAAIQELEEFGLLQWNGDRLLLTPRGRLLGNEVFQRFLT